MNAYELSDYVADNGYIGTGTTHEVSIMLRQQADRIAELEKEIEECWCGGHSYAYLRAKNRLPQTKPLSDEEINEISMRCYVYPADGSMIFNQHKFARAIEERHGIK